MWATLSLLKSTYKAVYKMYTSRNTHECPNQFLVSQQPVCVYNCLAASVGMLLSHLSPLSLLVSGVRKDDQLQCYTAAISAIQGADLDLLQQAVLSDALAGVQQLCIAAKVCGSSITCARNP